MRDNGAADIPSPLAEAQAALSRKRAGATQDLDQRQVPGTRERRGEASRRDVTTAQRALGVAGHVGERVHVGPRHDLDDEGCCVFRKPAPSLLLPRADERPGAIVVDDRRAGSGERETTSGALSTASDGPGSRRAAALAHGLVQAEKTLSACFAQRRARASADGAPLGQEKLEHVAIVAN